jgi:hypothetical protein
VVVAAEHVLIYPEILTLVKHHRPEDIVVLVELSLMVVVLVVFIVEAAVDMVTGDMDLAVDTVVVHGIELHQDMEALDRADRVSGEVVAQVMAEVVEVHRAV